MSILKRLLAFVLTTIMLCTATVFTFDVSAASTPSFTIKSVTGITPKNATLNATLSNPKGAKVTKVGYKLGTSKTNLTITNCDTGSWKYKTLTVDYKLSEDKVTLKPNTTYYYSLYAIVGGKTYNSTVNSFKTKKAPAFTINNESGITVSDATISAAITNPNKTKITKVGFQIGTAKDKLETKKYDSVSRYDKTVTASYKMSKYKVTLKENTTYYYRFYIVTGGETFYSAIDSFKTKSKAPTLAKPTATSITHNNVKIGVKVTNTYKLKITKAGYQIGTSKDNLSIKKSKNINSSSTSQNISFILSNYSVKLKPKTTYYYRTYVVANGKTYYSSVQSFKTIPETPTITYKSVSKLTYNSATLSFTLNNPAGYKVTKAGYEIGKSKGNLNIKKSKKISSDTSTSQDIGFNLKNYSVTLKEQTKYYYRVYVVANGKTYYGEVKSFTTPSSYRWPVPDSTNLTQPYSKTKPHYGIDIGGATKNDIVATKAGKVITVYSGCKNYNGGSNSCKIAGKGCALKTVSGTTLPNHCNGGYGNGVVIKHNDGTYASYAHMSKVTVKVGDKVSQGQTIGKLGSSGYSFGPHLHFGVYDSKGTNWKPNIDNTPKTGIAYTY